MEYLTCTASWQDLALPAHQCDMLRDMVLRVKQKPVINRWFGRFLPRVSSGSGVSALFTGCNGKAKIMAAQVLARELGFRLCRIDTSQLVSKYIGETEKNLARVFDEAGRADVVLLFDETDDLFSKRTDMKDSHDRYVNLHVNYLLQRLEAHQGVVIVASNRNDVLDQAMLRRFQYVIEFPC